MKKNKKLIAAAAAVIVAAIALFVIYTASRPATEAGAKTISVAVVHSDESEKTFTYQTDAEYLGEVLLKEGLVEGEQGQFGLYILTVDGETADYDKDGAYWALYQGEEYASVGADQLAIADGDAFSLVYTVG